MTTTTHRFRTDDGVELVYYVTPGDADEPPLVILHGFSGDAFRDFVDNGVIDALGADGRTIVALDQRGHGASGAPGGRSYPDRAVPGAAEQGVNHTAPSRK